MKNALSRLPLIRIIALAIAFYFLPSTPTHADPVASPLASDECTTPVHIMSSQIKTCGALKIVLLEGNPSLRAQSLGELVKRGEISNETLEYFSNVVRSSTQEMPWVARTFAPIFYHLWSVAQQKPGTDGLFNELLQFSAAAGIDFASVQSAIGVPDFTIFMTGIGDALERELLGLPRFGCTSISRRFQDGSFVYGRNLDFAGVRVWDAKPLLVITHPEPGSGELKHIAFSSAPLFFGSITGVNETGIALAIHENFSRDIYGRGVPVLLIGEEVLRKARSIEEAVEILRETRPGQLWTFVLTDLDRGRSIAVESSPHVFAIREMWNDRFAQTNHMIAASEQTRRKVEVLPFTTGRNSKLRLKLAMEMLSQLQTETSAEGAAKILAYQADPNGFVSSHQDIMKGLTIQTVVLTKDQAGKKRAYMAKDPAPTASGDYISFSLDEAWSTKDLALLETKIVNLSGTSAEKRKYQLEISDAYAAFHDHHDYPNVIRLLSDHRSTEAALVRSISYFRMDDFENADYEAAMALGRQDVAGLPAIRQSLTAMRILSRYSMGERNSALLQVLAYDLLSTEPENPSLREVARRISEGKKLRPQDRRISYDWFGGDLRWGLGL